MVDVPSSTRSISKSEAEVTVQVLNGMLGSKDDLLFELEELLPTARLYPLVRNDCKNLVFPLA
jgi:hypothetical protein